MPLVFSFHGPRPNPRTFVLNFVATEERVLYRQRSCILLNKLSGPRRLRVEERKNHGPGTLKVEG